MEECAEWKVFTIADSGIDKNNLSIEFNDPTMYNQFWKFFYFEIQS
jgi:hypothetical protein